MRSWPNAPKLVLVALAALIAAPGCQSGGNLDMIEREIRWKEDRIYHLEDHVEEYKRRLESARRENETLRKQLEEARGGSGDSWNPGAGGPPPLSPPPAHGPSGLPPVGNGPPAELPPNIGPPSIGPPGADAGALDDEPIISPPGQGIPEGIEVDAPPSVASSLGNNPPDGGLSAVALQNAIPPDDARAGGL
ncbi:MAG: hypothetical protein KDA63_19980, partial [Planctomycetales bacterium]|nr:hypothetical protein [Planctomycetales bacterium]